MGQTVQIIKKCPKCGNITLKKCTTPQDELASFVFGFRAKEIFKLDERWQCTSCHRLFMRKNK